MLMQVDVFSAGLCIYQRINNPMEKCIRSMRILPARGKSGLGRVRLLATPRDAIYRGAIEKNGGVRALGDFTATLFFPSRNPFCKRNAGERRPNDSGFSNYERTST